MKYDSSSVVRLVDGAYSIETGIISIDYDGSILVTYLLLTGTKGFTYILTIPSTTFRVAMSVSTPISSIPTGVDLSSTGDGLFYGERPCCTSWL